MSMKSEVKSVAIYARVALNENNALKRQVEEIEYITKANRYCSTKIYAEACSGTGDTEKSRKEWFRMLKDIMDGKIERVYVKSVDRIGRNYLFVTQMLEKLHSLNCPIYETSTKNIL